MRSCMENDLSFKEMKLYLRMGIMDEVGGYIT